MSSFPWIALSPRFRTTDVKRNWWIFRINLLAVFINSIAVIGWIFTWITS